MCNKKKLYCIVLLMICVPCILLCSVYADEGSQTIETQANAWVDGLPAVQYSQEETELFLSEIRWKRGSDTVPMAGLVRGIAALMTGDRCAVVADQLYLYERDQRVATYSFATNVSHVLFTDGEHYYILFERSGQVLQFDEAGNTVGYRLLEKEFTGFDRNRINRYYLTYGKLVRRGNYVLVNQYPPMASQLTESYDTFLWNENVIYTTKVRNYALITFAVLFVIAAFFVGRLVSIRILERKNQDSGAR